MILKRKIYKKLLEWKNECQGKKALLIEGARRIGKWFVPLGKYVLVPLSLVALIAGALLGGIG